MSCRCEAGVYRSWVGERTGRRLGMPLALPWTSKLRMAVGISLRGHFPRISVLLTVTAVARAVGVVARRIRGARQARALNFGHGHVCVCYEPTRTSLTTAQLLSTSLWRGRWKLCRARRACGISKLAE